MFAGGGWSCVSTIASMQTVRTRRFYRVLLLVTGVLITKVTIEVMLGYRNYFPPDFNSDFLRGRADYFFGSYRWAFYLHIITSPMTLFVGMLLISDRFRQRYPAWHRGLGRVQVVTVLFFVTPSGLWMARYASSGTFAAIGFAALAGLTGLCAACGWRAAVQRRFADHRRWMLRCYLLLCSAVLLRILGGLATVTGITAVWFDPFASWASWVVPVGVFEGWMLFQSRRTRNLVGLD